MTFSNAYRWLSLAMLACALLVGAPVQAQLNVFATVVGYQSCSATQAIQGSCRAHLACSRPVNTFSF